MNFLNELNVAQRAAVEQTDGPMLVVAGAGSGKTRVLTYKIAYLLAQGVPAYNILALTFTNKAAREMKSRISRLVGEDTARYLWMGTFHSIFSRILRQEADRLGYTRDYTIYDTADSKSLLKAIVKEMGLDDKVYKTSTLLGRISMAKNNLMTPQDYASDKDCLQQDKAARLYEMAKIFHLYNQRLHQSNAMDFDDLLFNMNVLLQACPDVREKYQQIFRYVLVDEYQDTNFSQYKIVTSLAAPQNNICVVGDDAQSIYAFRGATIANILNFQRQYSDSRLFKLEQNYRSTKNIVGAANSLIKVNKGQIPKEVFSNKEQGEKLHVHGFDTDRKEGEHLAHSICKKVQQRSGSMFSRGAVQRSYEDFAILYRTNSQSRVIEDELRKRGVPYRIYGGVAFYQRKEIKDAISYFRLIVNAQDDEALFRVINFPARGIGATTLNKVLALAHEKNISAFEVVSDPLGKGLNVNAGTATKLTRFAEMIVGFRALIPTMGAYEFALHVLTVSQVMQAAQADKTPEGKDRLDNLQELLSGIQEFEQDHGMMGTEFVPITDFLSEVSLLTDQDENLNDDTPRVSLMTVHSAKGLEFPIVFIAGLEDKLFPSAFAEDIREMEEERRLFYVAITRAEEECILTYARTRFRNGSVVVSGASPFIRDVDATFLERHDIAPTYTSHWSNPWIEERKAWSAPPQPKKEMPSYDITKLLRTTGQQPKGEKVEVQGTFAAGSRVRHATFGAGTVIRTYIENDNEKIEVRFDSSSTPKTLLLKFAKLERL